ncbi:MAG: FecR domain-containing protein [Cyclobacteriaceae bacterium]
MKSNYKNYTIEDFAQDTYFQKWVKNPDEECEEFWVNWLNKNSDRIFDINEASEIVKSFRFQEDEISEKNIENLWDNISNNIRKDNRHIHYRENKRSYGLLLKIAATLIPLFIIGYMLTQQDQSGQTEVSQQALKIKKENPNGKKTQFTLPDGTRVFLNANSALVYSSQFNEGIIRRVKLKGEAFFMVKRDEQRPFIVESGKLQTQVLGTSFNVRAFDYEDEISVAVEEGKVRLQDKTKDDTEEQLILNRFDMGVFQKERQSLELRKISGPELFDWRNGVIHFKKADFKEIQKTLEQWYGVSFEINDAVDTKKDFTGSYANKPLSTVLEGLQFVYGFNYEINDKTITIN